MPIFSFHEHELKADANVENYETEIQRALEDLKIPGLMQAYLLKGFKGERSGRYGVFWIWESEQCIKDNFGTLDNPKWPADWLRYENEILSKYLTCHPDKILFTAYTIIGTRTFNPESNLLKAKTNGISDLWAKRTTLEQTSPDPTSPTLKSKL